MSSDRDAVKCGEPFSKSVSKMPADPAKDHLNRRGIYEES